MRNADIILCSQIKEANIASFGRAAVRLGSKALGNKTFRSGLHKGVGLQADLLSKPFSGVGRMGLKYTKGPGAQKAFGGIQRVGDKLRAQSLVSNHTAKNLMGPGFRGGGKNPANWARGMAGDWLNQSMIYAPLYGMGAGMGYSALTGREAPQIKTPKTVETAQRLYSAPFTYTSPFWAGLDIIPRFLPGGESNNVAKPQVNAEDAYYDQYID